MKKEERLLQISKEIEKCQDCKKGKIGKAVPGEGNANAKIVFIGEAPGKTEAETGRPFVGRSGKLLRSLIRSIRLEEKDVYITSPVKYLPKYKTPNKRDIEHGRTHLLKQLEVINPKIIILLGAVACQAVLEKKIPVIAQHGKIIEYEGRKSFITLHPSAAIRFKKFRKILEEDFQKLKRYI